MAAKKKSSSAKSTSTKGAKAAVTTDPGISGTTSSDGAAVRIPSPSGVGMETPTEAPQHGGLTGSPSWTPPSGPDVAADEPGVPVLGPPAANLRGTPKASGANEEPYGRGAQGPNSPEADEPTQDLSALREAATTKAATGPEVLLTFDRGASEQKARAERERAVLRHGTSIRVRYLREAEDLGQAGGRPVRIELGYRFDALPVGMATIADGQRTREGALVRREPVLKVPTEARGELQLWFRVDLEDGRTLWDSLFGHNHRFRVQP